jgi:hypothetical protein
MIDLTGSWAYHVFGTKFVTIDENAGVVAIHDFNQLAYRREFKRTRGGPITGTQFVSADMSSCRLNVTTSLLYRKWTIAVTSSLRLM